MLLWPNLVEAADLKSVSSGFESQEEYHKIYITRMKLNGQASVS